MSLVDDSQPRKMPVLEYAVPALASKWKTWLIRARAVLLVVYGLVLGGALIVLRHLGSDLLPLIVTLIAFMVANALFLSGAPQWTWPRPRRRRSMIVSFGLGTLLGALLTLGLIASLMSLAFLLGFMPAMNASNPQGGSAWLPNSTWPLVLVPAVSWGLWLAVFGIMLRRQRWESVYPRLYLALLAGSWLELLITIPIDVQIRKRTACYCNEGTFFGLTVGLTMVAWVFGPGIGLLYLARRKQRRQAALPPGDGLSL